MIAKYRNKISGPLLDRIDIHVVVPSVKYKEMAGEATGETAEKIRERVESARTVQRKRLGKTNARMAPKEIKKHCALDDECQQLLKMAMTELNLSARAYDRILKVSRTIADLNCSESIQSQHISETIQYHTVDRQLWVWQGRAYNLRPRFAELLDLRDLRRGQSRKRILQIIEWIDRMSAATTQQCVDHRAALSGLRMANERIRLSEYVF